MHQLKVPFIYAYLFMKLQEHHPPRIIIEKKINEIMSRFLFHFPHRYYRVIIYEMMNYGLLRKLKKGEPGKEISNPTYEIMNSVSIEEFMKPYEDYVFW